ncbi:cupin domain-containing protein [Chloracidobacterium sp. MS 40/45]|uniref:cupin domain-containing protein n=1 Tax=Chloracidobacterium aggregatum TaxID=2851959 RepID=UPI001B8BF5A4|nr:cupin domain-containing protein [Chloracidobacterium aggregatum]QUV99592.1 cupin domain-containing protein [Chloracidobacterium sp. MS 40/45]
MTNDSWSGEDHPWEMLLGYLLETLAADERRAIENHLVDDHWLRTEGLETMRQLATRILESCAAEPPAQLRARLMSAIGQPSTLPPAPPEAIPYSALSRACDEVWMPWRPGWTTRLLYHSPAEDLVVALVRAEPGASLPPHRHHIAEEVLVLEGDLTVGEERLGPGDYIRSEAGTTHTRNFTTTGCTILVRRSLSECQAEYPGKGAE